MKIYFQILLQFISKLTKKIILTVIRRPSITNIGIFTIVVCLFVRGISPAFTQMQGLPKLPDSVIKNQNQILPDSVIKNQLLIDPTKFNFDNWNFEYGLKNWEKTGTAFNNQPTQGGNVVASRVISIPLGGDYWQDVVYPIGYKGNYWIGTYENHPKARVIKPITLPLGNTGTSKGTPIYISYPVGSIQGDIPTGTLISKPFEIRNNFITFLIGGGNDILNLKIELLEKVSLGGTITLEDSQYKEITGIAATGINSEIMRRDWWNVTSHKGKTARIRIVDNASGHWGHINIDDIRFTDNEPPFGPVPKDADLPIFTAYRDGDIWRDLDTPIWGFVDMHTHPMAHLGFGRKLLHGAPDIGSIIPAGTRDCNKIDIRSSSIQEALGHDNSTHGGPGFFDNPCGNKIRNVVINQLEQSKGAQSQHGQNSLGYSDDPSKAFVNWPKFNDITHQQMWIDWIKRSYEGGLRVMVALAVNSKTLADVISGDDPKDDKGSADLQISEIEQFVNRHNDFMEIATDPQHLRSIVRRNKLAVVIGAEIDNIGNFNTSSILTTEMIAQEIQRLYTNKVRYIFPIHVIDNKFGGTAVYEDAFNYSNKREYGSFWDLTCANPSEGISKQISKDEGVQIGGIFLGQDPLRNPPIPSCAPGIGHKNRKGLTPEGEFAIKEMMKWGMIIDIDHMSQESANQALEIARNIPGKYPLNSGHNGFRSNGGTNENNRTDDQLDKIYESGGIIGVGWGDNVSCGFLNNYRFGLEKMGRRQLAIGTDINGLVKAPRPRNASIDCLGSWVNYIELGDINAPLTMAQTGPKRWNYNNDGVAHYGLLPDFLQDLKNIGMTSQERSSLFMSAEHFAQMWEKSLEASSSLWHLK